MIKHVSFIFKKLYKKKVTREKGKKNVKQANTYYLLFIITIVSYYSYLLPTVKLWKWKKIHEELKSFSEIKGLGVRLGDDPTTYYNQNK